MSTKPLRVSLVSSAELMVARTCFEGEADREVGLADAGGSEDEDVLAGAQEAQGGQVGDDALVDSGLGVVVEVVEALAVGSAAELEIRRDAPFEMVRTLAAESLIEEPRGRALFAGGAFKLAVEM